MNRFQFKVLLVLFMVLDHIQPFVPDTLGLVFHVLTRFVAVGFGYLAVEGFIDTKDVKKYLLRLGVFALFMELGNKVLNTWFLPKDNGIHNNIILTMTLGIALLWIYREGKGRIWQTPDYSLLLVPVFLRNLG